jgi:flagellar assembly factor FliW
MSKAPPVSAASVVESRSAARVVEEIPVIEMVEAMPGFPDCTRFALVRLDEDGVLCSLKSVEDPDLRFLVVPPALFFPDYAPVIDDATVSALGIERADDVMVLVVVNPGEQAVKATANLLAPVVVNTVNRQATQVVLSEDLPVRAPLVA